MTDTPSGMMAMWASLPFSFRAIAKASSTSAAVSKPISLAMLRYFSHIT